MPPVHLAVPEKPFGLTLILRFFDRCGNSGFASEPSGFSTAAEIAGRLFLPLAAATRNPATGSAKPESPCTGEVFSDSWADGGGNVQIPLSVTSASRRDSSPQGEPRTTLRLAGDDTSSAPVCALGHLLLKEKALGGSFVIAAPTAETECGACVRGDVEVQPCAGGEILRRLCLLRMTPHPSPPRGGSADAISLKEGG